MQRRWTRILVIGGATLLAGSAATGQEGPGEKARDVVGRAPRVELVFVIDTTGSMGGLIEAAKQKVWGIVNEVMKAPGRPEVSIGLVAYRDKGDAYVTQVTPITRDLDKAYGTLMGYRAEGGGDTPEDVRRALADGVARAGWSPRAADLSQILFLVGDAPPHDDYADEPDAVATASAAARAGLIVNAIQCGRLPGTDVAWRQIARAGEGEYFAIAQDGGVVAVATPFDAELAKLGTQVGGTYMAYGAGGGMGGAVFRQSKAAAQARVEATFADAAPVAAQADRALNKVLNASAYDNNDLLQAVENGTVKLDALKAEELPDDLQKLAPAEREKAVAARIAERKRLREQIAALSRKRDEYLAEERRKQAGKGQAGFDEAVNAALRSQVARKGAKP